MKRESERQLRGDLSTNNSAWLRKQESKISPTHGTNQIVQLTEFRTLALWEKTSEMFHPPAAKN